MATTTRLNLNKPANADLVNVATAISNQMVTIDGAMGAGICTSSTRPTPTYTGQFIWETDTELLYRWNGTTWVLTADKRETTSLGEVAYVESTTDGATTSGNGNEVGPYFSVSFYGDTTRKYLISSYFEVGRSSAEVVYGNALIRYKAGTSVATSDTLLATRSVCIDDKILSISANRCMITTFTPPVADLYTIGLFLVRTNSSGTNLKVQGGCLNSMFVEDVGSI
jgi:hypothetical protein